MRARSTLQEIVPSEETAIEHVVARYQRVAPAVTRVARSLAENDELVVRLGSITAAKPNEIIIDPGTFQAAYLRRAPVTPTEVALASALHEVVHLVATDLEEQRPLPIGWLGKDAEPSEEPVDLLWALEEVGGKAAVSLFFALEDARQETVGLIMYPGAQSVLEDLYRSSLHQALENSKLLGQFSVACFMMVGGYASRDELERRCSPPVAVSLGDASSFTKHVVSADGPWEVADLALQLLAVARLHGLASDSAQSPAEKKQADADDLKSIEDGVDQVRLLSPIVHNADGYEKTKQVEQRSGPSEEQGPAEAANDAGTDQLLRFSQAPTVFLPTGQSGRLLVSSFPDRFRQFGTAGRQALKEAAIEWKVEQRHVSGELFPLFAANQRRGLRSGYDAGDISPHAPLFLGAGLYRRMYERRSMRTRRSYAVSLLIDGSASMLQPRYVGDTNRRASWGLAAATLGAWTLARLCHELQIDFEVAMFNRSFCARVDDSEWSYTRRRSNSVGGLRRSRGQGADRMTTTVNHYLLKPFNGRWRAAEDLAAGLFYASAFPTEAATEARRDSRNAPPVTMFEKAANIDEYNLSFAAQRMAKLGADVRVMVILADGMTRGSLETLSQSVEAVERTGTTVLGIGIGDDTVQMAYGRHQVVERPDELAQSMVNGVRDALRRSLILTGLGEWWHRAGLESENWKESIRG